MSLEDLLKRVEFTPGPWVIDPKFASEVQTPLLQTVATCWHQVAAGSKIEVTGVLECSLEESAANARLIAAAPDMFEALKAASHALRSYQYGNASTELAKSIADACDSALLRALISQKEGVE